MPSGPISSIAIKGLQLRNISPTHRVTAKLRADRPAATSPNEIWAMDYVRDQLFDGRKIRVSERVGLVNRIGSVLATLGIDDYNPLLQGRHRRLANLRTGLGAPIPPNARAKIERLLSRLELVLAQIAELERERDAVIEAVAPDEAGGMIQRLCSLRGIGVQSATVLVREAFVRHFANGKALGSYAGLTATSFNSGGVEREQGIGKAGNRRLRSVMVELAWLWLRYQPGAAPVAWFRERTGSAGRRVRKVMLVALARKLLIALWRFVVDGVIPGGATMKSAA